jgi:hypothetical protein
LSFKDYLEIKDSLVPRLATGFGGGIGRKGSLCGAFTGSIMAIGMKMGRTDPKDKEAVTKVYSGINSKRSLEVLSASTSQDSIWIMRKNGRNGWLRGEWRSVRPSLRKPLDCCVIS